MKQQHLRSNLWANSYHFKIRPQLFFSSSVIPWTDESYILAKPLIACFKNSHRRENLISEPLRILDGRQFTNSLSFVKKWSVWQDECREVNYSVQPLKRDIPSLRLGTSNTFERWGSSGFQLTTRNGLELFLHSRLETQCAWQALKFPSTLLALPGRSS